MATEKRTSVVRYLAATDNRLIGLLLPAEFDDHGSFQPDDGRRSYVTDANFPLQIIAVRGSPDDKGSNHVHTALEAADNWPTRHKVIVCVAGAVRMHLSEMSGVPVGSADLGPGDALLCTEGHELVYLEPRTRVIEVKQGPYPGSQEADRIVLE